MINSDCGPTQAPARGATVIPFPGAHRAPAGPGPRSQAQKAADLDDVIALGRELIASAQRGEICGAVVIAYDEHGREGGRGVFLRRNVGALRQVSAGLRDCIVDVAFEHGLEVTAK